MPRGNAAFGWGQGAHTGTDTLLQSGAQVEKEKKAGGGEEEEEEEGAQKAGVF